MSMTSVRLHVLCLGCVAALALVTALPVRATATADWVPRLEAALKRLDADGRPDIGVYVRDLDTGRAASWKADQLWYLASTVKLPVALTVLDQVQRGALTLDSVAVLEPADIVDGAGPTRLQPLGARLTVRWLLEQMMVWSDNTATDMLIRTVGLAKVNALVQRVVPQGFQPITTLADVRRRIYGGLTPAAARLSGLDFVQLQAQRSDAARRQYLARLLRVPESGFRLASVAEAYDAYYASGVNSARLDAYGALLARVVQGEVLDPARTAWLLALMERVKTGTHRIRAGLPDNVRWAHKTGTQAARTCDSGIVTVPRPGRDHRIVVAACTRGEKTLAGAESALLQVGAAICRSGVLGVDSTAHDLHCRTDTPALPWSTDPPPDPVAGSDAAPDDRPR